MGLGRIFHEAELTVSRRNPREISQHMLLVLLLLLPPPPVACRLLPCCLTPSEEEVDEVATRQNNIATGQPEECIACCPLPSAFCLLPAAAVGNENPFGVHVHAGEPHCPAHFLCFGWL